jgi:hypothetical protein
MPDPAEVRAVGGCLRAAVDGPFFPDGEFPILIGPNRPDMRAIMEAWPVQTPPLHSAPRPAPSGVPVAPRAGRSPEAQAAGDMALRLTNRAKSSHARPRQSGHGPGCCHTANILRLFFVCATLHSPAT